MSLCEPLIGHVLHCRVDHKDQVGGKTWMSTATAAAAAVAMKA